MLQTCYKMTYSRPWMPHLATTVLDLCPRKRLPARRRGLMLSTLRRSVFNLTSATPSSHSSWGVCADISVRLFEGELRLIAESPKLLNVDEKGSWGNRNRRLLLSSDSPVFTTTTTNTTPTSNTSPKSSCTWRAREHGIFFLAVSTNRPR